MVHNLLNRYKILMESSKALSEYDSLCTQIVTENYLNPVYKPVNSVSPSLGNTYSKLLNDSYSLLRDISVDSAALESFFSSVQIPPNTRLVIKDAYKIGKIKTEFIDQLIKDAAGDINLIINNKKSMNDVMAFFNNMPAIRIKRQIVMGVQPPMDNRDYLSKTESDIVITDPKQISANCISFVKAFPQKRLEVDTEVTSLNQSITSAYTKLAMFSATINRLKDENRLPNESINTLNYYVFNINHVVDDVVSYATFMLITKINALTYNVNSYNDLYNTLGRPRINKESVFADDVLQTNDNFMTEEMTQGDASAIINWANQVYDKIRSMYTEYRDTDKAQYLDVKLDNYKKDDSPYDPLNRILIKISSSFDNIKHQLQDKYVAPEDVFNNSYLSNQSLSNLERQANIISIPSNNVYAISNGDKMFLTMAELRDSTPLLSNLANNCKNVRDKFLELDSILSGDDPSISFAVKQDALNILRERHALFDHIINSVCKCLIKRYAQMERACCGLLEVVEKVIDVPNRKNENSDYNTLAKSILDIDRITNICVTEKSMQEYKRERLKKEYGIVLEDGDDDKKTDENKDDKKPDVKEDTSKMSDADKDQNKKAADEADNNNDKKDNDDGEKKKKKSVSDVLAAIGKFFDDIINKFKDNTTKITQNDSAFLKNNKQAILDRSVKGITINMYPYTNRSSSEFVQDMDKLKNNIASITPSNIGEYKSDEDIKKKIFNFTTIPDGVDFSTFFTNYCKYGQEKAVSLGDKTEVEKTSFTNDACKNLINDMVTFCDDAINNNGATNVAEALVSLKSATETMVKAFTDDSDNLANVTSISNKVQTFSTAIKVAHQNKYFHYINALRKLKPTDKSSGENKD